MDNLISSRWGSQLPHLSVCQYIIVVVVNSCVCFQVISFYPCVPLFTQYLRHSLHQGRDESRNDEGKQAVKGIKKIYNTKTKDWRQVIRKRKGSATKSKKKDPWGQLDRTWESKKLVNRSLEEETRPEQSPGRSKFRTYRPPGLHASKRHVGGDSAYRLPEPLLWVESITCTQDPQELYFLLSLGRTFLWNLLCSSGRQATKLCVPWGSAWFTTSLLHMDGSLNFWELSPA